MNNIKIFESSEFGNVRTLEGANGDVLFCGVDIAKSLGYTNTRKALSDHCKKDGVTKRYVTVRARTRNSFYIRGQCLQAYCKK